MRSRNDRQVHLHSPHGGPLCNCRTSPRTVYTASIAEATCRRCLAQYYLAPAEHAELLRIREALTRRVA